LYHLTKVSNGQTQKIMNRIKYFVTIFAESEALATNPCLNFGLK